MEKSPSESATRRLTIRSSLNELPSDPVAIRHSDTATPAPVREDLVREDSARQFARHIAVVWLSFLVFSFWQAPIPAVNEPHWLTKAKHYWQPDWCHQDFFLESSNTHLVYYQTIGALTSVVSLAETALIGRVLGYLLLAVGWTSLCRSATGRIESAFPAAWLFLLLASIGNLSGEWLVSGIEGKVFSYGFVFLGLAKLLETRWVHAGLFTGMGIAFHPLIGIWSVIACGMAVAFAAASRTEWRTSLTAIVEVIRQPPFLVGVAVLIAISLAGVLPALQAIGGSTPHDTRVANFLQVFHRLDHHLDPMEFAGWRYGMYLTLGAAAWLLIRLGEQRSQMTWLGRVVLASVFIAAVGWVVGYRDSSISDGELFEKMPLYDLRSNLLKFYPFRLVDIVLPVLVAILLARHVTSRLDHFHPRAIRVGLVAAIIVSLWLANGRGSVNRMSPQQQADWLEACQWLRDNTDEDALVHTPRQSWAFKWFAQRAGYVALKDCPQDAAGIIEWNNRLNGISDWAEKHHADEIYSRDETAALHQEKGITHLLVRRLGPFEAKPDFQNSTYRIYRIQPR
jgi:hypothetical protein